MRGLRTKLHHLLESAQDCHFDVLVLTETWLNDGFFDAELNLPQYTIYRKDRSSDTSTCRRGGGTLIAVHKSIPSKCLRVPEIIEQVFVSIGSPQTGIILGAVYFPPRSSGWVYTVFSDTLDRVTSDLPTSTLCLVGDFNLSHGFWQTNALSSTVLAEHGAPLEEVAAIEEISNACSYHNLFQVNCVRNAYNSLLDLVLTQDGATNVCAADYVLVPPDPYHPPLYIEICTSALEDSNILNFEGFYRDFRSANFCGISGFLDGINWDNLLKDKNLDVMINIFYEVLYLCIDLFVPLKKYSARKFPVWYSLELKNCIINKKIAHKRYKTTHSQVDYREFSRLRGLCRELTRNCYNAYIVTTEQSIFSNLKQFWSFVNNKRNNNHYPSEFTYENRKSCTGQDIANMFADYFATVYSKNTRNTFSDEISINNLYISNHNILISQIYTKLSSLDINKGPGPDGLPAIFLKYCSFNLSRPLFHIFNLSLSTGVFPDFWKVSFITPIFKTGDRSLVTNYRPISILSIIPKVFESLVCDFLTPRLDSLLIDQQFGFRPRKSTELNLLTHVDYLSDALESGLQVDTIYTDFSKAFDRVSHSVLLLKLKTMGLGEPLLSWFKSYLSHRRQIVRIGNFHSYEIENPSGVPQGSHLGPILFNIFINDIHECVQYSQFQLFADDLKLSRQVLDLGDCELLQRDVDSLVDWCGRNEMALNPSKCKVITFHRTRNPTNFEYSINNTPLERISEVRDLGVTLDTSLNFISHLSGIVSRALQMLGFIKRCTVDFNNIAAFKWLYCALVRPYLEYASCVWSPYYNVHKNALERVQHKFLKHAAYKMHLIDYTYEEILSELNMTTILTRHHKRDLITLFNILHDISSAPVLLSKINLHVPSRTTRSISSFSIPLHRTNYGYNAYISRASRLANSHNQIDFFCTPNQFLAQLKGALL